MVTARDIMFSPSPTIGVGGASNAPSAYFQNLASGQGTSSSALVPGTDPWGNLRNVTPGVGLNNNMGDMGGALGWNFDTGLLALGGLETIGNLWAAWEANKLAKKQFAFQKDITEQNLANQIQAYNTTLDDRIRSRAHTEGMSPEAAQSYIDEHRLG